MNEIELPCISLRPHWAEAIFALGKDVENRTWRTNTRGWIAIHSSSKLVQRENKRLGVTPTATQAVIGLVHLDSIVKRSRSEWAMAGHWHWLLSSPLRLPSPVACRGRLNVFTVELDLPVDLLKRIKEPLRS